MAPGPVRWSWIASSVASETFPTGVRFRGWMSEAEGFLCSRLPASLTWPARRGLCRPSSHDRHGLCPGHGLDTIPARAAARPAVPLVSRIACISESNRFARASGGRLHSRLGRSRGPSPGVQPGRRTRSPGAHPGRRTRSPGAHPGRRTRSPGAHPGRRTRSPGAHPGRRTRSPGRADLGGARARPRPWRLAGSWQRIDGVSRLLPYSDLLALTSSSRRGEGVSDRGSWKRLRILLTGHGDAHAEP